MVFAARPLDEQQPEPVVENDNVTNGLDENSAPNPRRFRVKVSQASASLNTLAAPSSPVSETQGEPVELQEKTSTKIMQTLFVCASVFWLAGWSVYAFPSAKTAIDFGILISAGFAPVLLMGLIGFSLSRKQDAQMYAAALRAELASIVMPGEAREKLIGSELSRMMDQAAEVTRSTKTTLSTLETMREGVREQLREFANLTRLAQSHIVTLSNEVQGKTEDVAGITERLESLFTRLSETTKDAEERLNTVQGTFTGTTAKIEDSVAGIEERMGTLGIAFDTRMVSVVEMTERMSTEVGRVERLVSDQQNRLSGSVAAMVEQGSAAVASVENAREGLHAELIALQSAQTDITKGIEDSAAALGKATDTMLDASRETIATHDERTTRLHQALDLWRDLLKTFEHRNAETAGIVREVMDRITSLSELSDTTGGNVRDMADLLQNSLSRMTETGDEVDAKVKLITAAVDRQSEAMRLSGISLSERAEQTDTRVKSALNAVQQAITTLDERHLQMDDTLTRRLEDLRAAASKAVEQTEHVRQTLRQQVQDMAGATGEIAGHAGAITEQLSQHRAEVKSIVTLAEGELQTFAQSLSALVVSLRAASTQQQDSARLGETKLATFVAQLENAAKSLHTVLEDGETAVDGATKRLDANVSTARTALDATATQLNDALSTLTPALDTAHEDTLRLTTQIQALSAATKTSLNQVDERLNETGDALERRLSSLTSTSETVDMRMRAVSEVAVAGLEALNGAAQSAETRVRQVGQMMERQADDVHLLTDRFVSRIERVQKQVDEGFRDLSTAISQALTQLETAGQAMTRQAGAAETDTGRVVDGVARIGDRVRLEVGQLLSQLGLLQTTMSDMSAEAGKQQSALLDAGDTAISTMRERTALLETMLAGIRGKLATDVSALRDLLKTVESQYAKTTGAGDGAAQSMERIVASVLTHIAGLDDKVAALGQQASKITQGVLDSGQTLSTIGARVLDAARISGDDLSRTALQLEGTVSRVQQAAADLKDNQVLVQRDAFLSSARFILESLHALSVDFVRGIEGDLPDKAWKSYEKGDIAAMTQRFIATADRMPMDKLREKVASDTEFRTYATRYIRLFEDLVGQAQATDQGALLATGFLTSDIGRVYALLCQATGREAKRLA